MKIKISRQGVCGKAIIPPGEYWVSLRSESQEIALAGKGKDILLPAVRRSQKGKGRATAIQFYCGGGTCWSLVVSSPQVGEWISLIDLAADEDDKKS